mmetsp:Transcript_13761/g.26684  ORF Transcript_13761/g.26684 Transcript_13761/m.26684 type:complete len:519 (+) Transcript_13761:83-1639(+)
MLSRPFLQRRLCRCVVVTALILGIWAVTVGHGLRLSDFLDTPPTARRRHGGSANSRIWAASHEDDGIHWTEIGDEVPLAWKSRWQESRARVQTVPVRQSIENSPVPGFVDISLARRQVPAWLSWCGRGPLDTSSSTMSSLLRYGHGPKPWEQWIDVMRKSSVFVVLNGTDSSVRNTVVERFFNGKAWVYVRHFTSLATEIIQLFEWQSRVYVVTANGDLLERRRTRKDDLEWYAIRGMQLSSSILVSHRRRFTSAYFVDLEGRILERRGSPPEVGKEVDTGAPEEEFYEWVVYDSEYSSTRARAERILTIVDAEGLEPGVLLFVSENGSLLRGSLNFRTHTISIEHVGSPSGRRIQPAPGVMSGGKLLLTTDDGDLLQISVGTEGGRTLQWTVFERPDDSFALSPSLGPVLGYGRAVFGVSQRGELLAVELGTTRIQWWSHKTPIDPETGESVRLRRMGARQLDEESLVFYTEDSRLAIYVLRDGNWVWTLEELPEVGLAQYCVGDRSSDQSCMSVGR